MKKKSILLLFNFAFCLFAFSQVTIFPSNWWVGMKHNKVQLLLQQKEGYIFPNKISISCNNKDVVINNIVKLDNKRYLILDISIKPNAKVSNTILSFNAIVPNESFKVNFELKPRRTGRNTAFAQGVNASDFVYLLMPERFSNGDKSNDKIAGMLDQSLDRDSMYLRHGGDLQGVINHLDYLQNLGVTSLWMTPVLENNQPNRTEHGYAFTNHYSIDPRFGGADAYKKLSDELHKRGMKLIQDAVYNHIGDKHILFKDAPAKDWFHQWDKFTKTSYKDQPIFDPYSSAKDRKITQDGWFTQEMPDWNQSNPYVANFLIQHAIWSVEEFGIDGWRIDTYLYNDLDFMNKCNKALTDEYPKMTMFGETWVHGVPSQAYYTENICNTKFKSNLQGATDFQTLFYGIQPALNEKFGWTEGVNKLYTTLAFDYLYKDPNRNCIMLDNHDLPRTFTSFGEDIAKMKIAFAWLFTCRGIPQAYYGSEVLMKGGTNPDGWVRLDFPGGWDGDKKNAFTSEGLTADEKMMQEYVKVLANFRKKSSAITKGKMMQYVPQDGVYVYFRYDEKQTIMCVMNTDEKQHDINFDDYTERTKGFTKANDIVTNNIVTNKFAIPAKTMWVLELEK
jgi:glycosidase